MEIVFRTDIENIQLHNPVKHNDIAVSPISDAESNPIVVEITHVCGEEDIHVAGTHAYIDLSVGDTDDILNQINKLDEHFIQTVLHRHADPAWFDKTLPSEVIRDHFSSSLRTTNTQPTPFLRLKTGFDQKTKQPVLKQEVEDENAAPIELQTLESLRDKKITYVVQLTSLRFLKRNFCCEFMLQHVKLVPAEEVEIEKTSPESPEDNDINLANLILNNQPNRELVARETEIRVALKERKLYLQELEELKLKVEQEVANILQKRDDLEENYRKVVEDIARMEQESATKSLLKTEYEEEAEDASAVEECDVEHAIDDDIIAQDIEEHTQHADSQNTD